MQSQVTNLSRIKEPRTDSPLCERQILKARSVSYLFPSSWALRCVLWEFFFESVWFSGQPDVRSGTSMPPCCVVNAIILYAHPLDNSKHRSRANSRLSEGRKGHVLSCNIDYRIPWLNPSMFPFTTQHVVIVPERTSDCPEEKLSKHPDNGGKDIRGMGYILVQWVSKNLVPVFARQKSMDSKKAIETSRNCRN